MCHCRKNRRKLELTLKFRIAPHNHTQTTAICGRWGIAACNTHAFSLATLNKCVWLCRHRSTAVSYIHTHNYMHPIHRNQIVLPFEKRERRHILSQMRRRQPDEREKKVIFIADIKLQWSSLENSGDCSCEINIEIDCHRFSCLKLCF